MVSSPLAASGALPDSNSGAIHRLVRTLSSRSAKGDAGSDPGERGDNGDKPEDALHRTTSAVSASSDTTKKRRISVGDRLKKLGKDLPLGKLRKVAGYGKGALASPRVSADGQLPANDIGSGGSLSPPTSAASSPGAGPSSAHAKMLSMVAELDEPSSTIVGTPTLVETNPTTPSGDKTPTAQTLARRIQDLVDSLPFPSFPDSPSELPPVKPPKPPARDKDGRPIPPPNSNPIKDSKLLSFLSSASIMNGTRSDGSRRPSVWSVLEGISAPPHGFPPTGDEAERGGNGETQHEGDDEQDIFSDNSSIMVYSPLIPTRDSHVELAELVPVSVEEEFVPEGPSQGSAGDVLSGTSWTSVWPLSIFKAPASEVPQLPVAKRLSGEVVISSQRTSADGAGRKIRTQTVRAWVPSDTKISVQAMWWGYRLYLPPPVLAILSDKTIEATKRAAMITTALTWFFNNLPITSLPVAVQPAALLLRRLAPFLGYIGTFISWSWSTIKSYDIGFGVTLTATWLLPIALIPGTWHEYDFPKSPSQPPAAPLPPTGSPTPTPSSPPTSLPTSPGSPTPTNPSLPNSPPPTSPVPNSPYPTTPSLPTSPTPPKPANPPVCTPIPDSGLPTPTPDPVPLPDSPTSSPTISSAGKWKLPKGPTLPRSFWPRALSPSRSSSSSALPTLTSQTAGRKTVEIPVPPTPPELPPIPPIPTSRPSPPPGNVQGVALEDVPLGSPLMNELLNGPVLGPVPLPDDDTPSAAEGLKVEVEEKKKKEKGRKGLFGLGTK